MPVMEELLGQLGTDLAAIRELQARQMKGEALSDDERRLLDEAKNTREGTKFVSPHASDEHNNRTAREKGADLTGGGRPISHPWNRERPSGAGLIRTIVAARKDPRAYEALTRGVEGKAWQEAVGSAGGFLVGPEQLPGYIEQRRASSPLRELCVQHSVASDEVWVTVEGNPISVQHLAESVTKPNTTGTLTQKISTVHKVAGTTTLSDELLADSNGEAERLVATQFGQSIGITVDTAIISGTGSGQPMGIRNTTGVNAVAVDGQTGQALFNSILKAIGRLRAKFFDPAEVTVVVHPRDLTKFELATATDNSYLLPGGLAAHVPAQVVADANVPTNLGAGVNESVIIVGAFRAGAHFYQRQPLTIEASSDAGFVTDETIVRGVERYGFAVVVPSAFELLTGITP